MESRQSFDEVPLGRLTGIIDAVQRMHGDAWAVLKAEGADSPNLKKMEQESYAYLCGQADYLEPYGLMPARGSRGNDGAFCGFSLIVSNLARFAQLAERLPDQYFAPAEGRKSPLHEALSTFRYQLLNEQYSHELRQDIGDYDANREWSRIAQACRQFRRVGIDEEDVAAIEERVKYWAENLTNEHDLATWCAGSVADLLAMKDRLLFERAILHAEESLAMMIECEEREDGDAEALADHRQHLQEIQALRRGRGF